MEYKKYFMPYRSCTLWIHSSFFVKEKEKENTSSLRIEFKSDFEQKARDIERTKYDNRFLIAYWMKIYVAKLLAHLPASANQIS